MTFLFIQVSCYVMEMLQIFAVLSDTAVRVPLATSVCNGQLSWNCKGGSCSSHLPSLRMCFLE
jgi:hypothetical protein